MAKYWNGTPPAKCNICNKPLDHVFYDMRLLSGTWAFLCTDHALNGPGIGKTGTGFGQKYVRQEHTGKWLKVEG